MVNISYCLKTSYSPLFGTKGIDVLIIKKNSLFLSKQNFISFINTIFVLNFFIVGDYEHPYEGTFGIASNIKAELQLKN